MLSSLPGKTKLSKINEIHNVITIQITFNVWISTWVIKPKLTHYFNIAQPNKAITVKISCWRPTRNIKLGAKRNV
jgi:hypothetical protein